METASLDFISRKIREPLHSIIGFIKLIMDGVISDAVMQKEILAIVYEQSQRLRNVIDAITDTNVIGSSEIKRQSVSLKEIIKPGGYLLIILPQEEDAKLAQGHFEDVGIYPQHVHGTLTRYYCLLKNK